MTPLEFRSFVTRDGKSTFLVVKSEGEYHVFEEADEQRSRAMAVEVIGSWRGEEKTNQLWHRIWNGEPVPHPDWKAKEGEN